MLYLLLLVESDFDVVPLAARDFEHSPRVAIVLTEPDQSKTSL